jgi:hypothetical protein
MKKHVHPKNDGFGSPGSNHPRRHLQKTAKTDDEQENSDSDFQARS